MDWGKENLLKYIRSKINVNQNAINSNIGLTESPFEEDEKKGKTDKKSEELPIKRKQKYIKTLGTKPKMIIFLSFLPDLGSFFIFFGFF